MSEVAEAKVELAPVEAPKKPGRVITPQRMALAEQWRADWVVNAEEGTTIEEVVSPMFWAHMAVQMNPFDRVEVRLETGEWVAELIVINTARNWAQVYLAHKYDLTKRSEAVAEAQRYDILWKGPQHRFTVVRRSDSQMVMNNFQTRDAATEWLATYERTVGPV